MNQEEEEFAPPQGFDSGGNQSDEFDDYGMEDFSQHAPSSQQQNHQSLQKQQLMQQMAQSMQGPGASNSAAQFFHPSQQTTGRGP